MESTVIPAMDYGQVCLGGGPEDIGDDSDLDPAQLWEMPGHGIPTNTPSVADGSDGPVTDGP